MVTSPIPQLLRANDVCKLMRISRASLYRKVSSGQFVPPIYLSVRMPRWDADQIHKWIAAKTPV